ncbi:MAG: hypothetical protein ACTS3F_01665 [Phycisphaerales bacterium]
MTKPLLTTALLTAALSITGCSNESPSQPEGSNAGSSGAQASSQSDPAKAWILTSAPAGDVGIVAAKDSAKEGDSLILRGRIGGRMEPISDESPVFTIVDLSLPHCGEKAHDSCPSPWDYCCDTPETITAHSATVQLVDAEGRTIDTGAGLALDPLDEVIVVGTVGPRQSAQVLTIRATGVYRVGG